MTARPRDVLAQATCAGMKYVAAGMNPMIERHRQGGRCRSVRAEKNSVRAHLQENRAGRLDLGECRSDIGKLIADAMDKVEGRRHHGRYSRASQRSDDRRGMRSTAASLALLIHTPDKQSHPRDSYILLRTEIANIRSCCRSRAGREGAIRCSHRRDAEAKRSRAGRKTATPETCASMRVFGDRARPARRHASSPVAR